MISERIIKTSSLQWASNKSWRLSNVQTYRVDPRRRNDERRNDVDDAQQRRDRQNFRRQHYRHQMSLHSSSSLQELIHVLSEIAIYKKNKIYYLARCLVSALLVFLKLGQHRPLFSFHPFHNTMTNFRIQFETKLKKPRCCAWDSNPGCKMKGW